MPGTPPQNSRRPIWIGRNRSEGDRLKAKQTKSETSLPNGLSHWSAYISEADQSALVVDLRRVIAQAPFIRPMTRWGKPMSVRMTATGRLGWVIEGGRYTYRPKHPETGRPWPQIPEGVLRVWRDLSSWNGDPDCCLINWYGEGAKMGLHRDADEGDAAFDAPVLSISLGDPACFRFGGTERGGPTRSLILRSGDVLAMGGASRLIYHGVDRISFGESGLLPNGGRINLTLRVVKSA